MKLTQANLSKLNPDAYSRFQCICNEINRHFAPGKQLSILDIGGSSRFLYTFLKKNGIDASLSIVDIVDYDNKPKQVKFFLQSAETLSFDDNSYDVVTGIDMLEHIPNENMKNNIISEAIRVSRGLVIFAGPCDTSMVTEYEVRLNNHNNVFFDADQKWLAEHFKYGKPKIANIVGCYEKNGLDTEVFSVLPLNDWYLSSLANLMPAVTPSVSFEKVESINQNYNLRFGKIGHKIEVGQGILNEGYRTFVVGRKNGLKPNKDAVDRKYIDNIQDLEAYTELVFKTLHELRHAKKLKDDLVWYKKENKRLLAEITKLSNLQNSVLTNTNAAAQAAAVKSNLK